MLTNLCKTAHLLGDASGTPGDAVIVKHPPVLPLGQAPISQKLFIILVRAAKTMCLGPWCRECSTASLTGGRLNAALQLLRSLDHCRTAIILLVRLQLAIV